MQSTDTSSVATSSCETKPGQGAHSTGKLQKIRKRDILMTYSLPKHSKLPFSSTCTTDPDSDIYDSDGDYVWLPLPIPTVADFHRLSHSALTLPTTPLSSYR
jgi:hypothetical protein